ncbi:MULTISPECIES: hypothetical protein [unclassified Mesorhizobium]|uniref:hypothetical protein n=1 Tax=unclassified Mesorhizobium TaxID=325217 RepID=UPI0003CE8A38|nr:MULTISPECIES: hypothetical protein [unclassified Mesorhizobium]ESX18440.1 hypothetical protein X767_24660 [Mesorhizobium sp. LSJC264A00]ESX91347.1 hypothetical protein X756_04025 [Mesorhizobium sp. LSHC412B00]
MVVLEFNSWCQLGFGTVVPNDFINWILQNFAYVYRVEKGTGNMIRVGNGDGWQLLHSNLVLDACVSAIVISNFTDKLPAQFRDDVLLPYVSTLKQFVT